MAVSSRNGRRSAGDNNRAMARISRAGPRGLRRNAAAAVVPTVRRHHEALEHTADVGLRAAAAGLPSLFEEAAVALAEVMAEFDALGARAGDLARRDGELIELEADDLVGLAFAWLNELIGRAQAAGEALLRTAVERIDEAPGGLGWRLRARAWLIPYREGEGMAVRPCHDVKSATYHRLTVRRQRGGWTLTAYLDV